MPSASVRIAAIVKVGLGRRTRAAYRMSCWSHSISLMVVMVDPFTDSSDVPERAGRRARACSRVIPRAMLSAVSPGDAPVPPGSRRVPNVARGRALLSPDVREFIHSSSSRNGSALPTSRADASPSPANCAREGVAPWTRVVPPGDHRGSHYASSCRLTPDCAPPRVMRVTRGGRDSEFRRALTEQICDRSRRGCPASAQVLWRARLTSVRARDDGGAGFAEEARRSLQDSVGGA